MIIYSSWIYIDYINDNNVSLSKKAKKFAATVESELRQNIIFNKHMLIL